MTQTQPAYAFAVIGKDRLSGPWITQQFVSEEGAVRWAQRRAFVLPDSGGNAVRKI